MQPAPQVALRHQVSIQGLSSINFQIFNMYVFWKLAIFSICDFMASATQVSMMTYQTSKAGMVNIKTSNTQSNIECAALCLGNAQCDGYQIAKDENGIVCKMKALGSGMANAPKENVYQQYNVALQETTATPTTLTTQPPTTLTIQPPTTLTTQTSTTVTTQPTTTLTTQPSTTLTTQPPTTPFILPENCVYTSNLQRSMSMAKFGDIIWMFSNNIGRDICRVRTVREILEFCHLSRCEDSNRTSVAMFPQFPDGDVRIAMGKNGNFIVFTDPFQFASYYVDGTNITILKVTAAPPEESKTALSAIMIQNCVIFYLQDGTTTCYPDVKFISWASGNDVIWANSETEMQTCNTAVDLVSRALRAKIAGNIVGITRINNTYFVASSDIVTCEIYL